MEAGFGIKELYLNTQCDNPNQGSVANTSRLYGSTKSLIDVDISDSHDTECSHPLFDTLYDNTSFHVKSESNISRLYGSIKSLIDVGITDSHDTECSHPQYDTLYDNSSFHLETESSTSRLYGSTKSLTDVDISGSHDTKCSQPSFDTLYDNTSFHVESESNTSRLYGSNKSLIDAGITDSHDEECSHPQHDTLYDNRSFRMERESNSSRLYGSTMHLIEIKISESCYTECSHRTFHTLYDNTSCYMETENNTTPDNNHKGHSARFLRHLSNTNHIGYNISQSSMPYCDEKNKGMFGEIICQKTNTMTAVPDDVVLKKSKQSLNNFQIAQSPGRNVVDRVEYDCNEVNISSESDISNNNNGDVDPRTNNNVSETQTQSCLDDPPDGGWGWVVTFSAFMVGFILDGISFSFGLFFKELYVYFNESKSLTSWIISVFNGTYLGIGKLSTVLCS